MFAHFVNYIFLNVQYHLNQLERIERFARQVKWRYQVVCECIQLCVAHTHLRIVLHYYRSDIMIFQKDMISKDALLVMCRTYLVEYPCAENGLSQIIEDENSSQLKRFAVGHEARANLSCTYSVPDADCQRRPWRRYHGPIFYSRVYKRAENIID